MNREFDLKTLVNVEAGRIAVVIKDGTVVIDLDLDKEQANLLASALRVCLDALRD